MAERALVCLGRFDFVAFADDAKPITLFFLSEVLGLALFTPNLALLDSLEPLLGACWLCASDIDFWWLLLGLEPEALMEDTVCIEV